MFKNKTWKEAAEKLKYMQEEYDFIYKINEKRMQNTGCKHNKKVYMTHLPLNQLWMRFCDECGEFSPIMCGHGGSGYMCPECIPKLAKEVVIV